MLSGMSQNAKPTVMALEMHTKGRQQTRELKMQGKKWSLMMSLTNLHLSDKPRPLGQKEAKRAAYEAKVQSMSSSTEDADVRILKEAQAKRL